MGYRTSYHREIGETGKVTAPQIELLERMIGSREDPE